MTDDAHSSTEGKTGESRVFRGGGVSYLRIPAGDAHETARFYRRVFGWTIDTDRPEPSFEDGTGHVIGHFVTDSKVAGEAGVRPYVYVEGIDDTLAQVPAHGGAVVQEPYPEGDLWVANISDPSGNVVGVWQHGTRR